MNPISVLYWILSLFLLVNIFPKTVLFIITLSIILLLNTIEVELYEIPRHNLPTANSSSLSYRADMEISKDEWESIKQRIDQHFESQETQAPQAPRT
jgi:hypothetical protein